MIIFDKIIPKPGTTYIIRFKNEKNNIIDIPIDKFVAHTMGLYFNKLSENNVIVERKNVEDLENSE